MESNDMNGPTQQTVGFQVSGKVDGPWITMSHPIGTDRTVWGPQIATLERDFRVLAYDTRGHGQGPAPTDGDFDDLARDVLSLWDQLGIRQSHFAGLSLGGCIGVALAAIAPTRVTSLTVACSRIMVDQAASQMWEQRAALVQAQGMAPIIDATLERWFTPQAIAAARPEIAPTRRMLEHTSPQGYAAASRALAKGQSIERLQALSVPVQYILGIADKGVPADEIRRYHAATPGATLVEIDGPHLLHVEQPAAFWDAVCGFARQHPR
jgi:3-oxoadipate enol-lactonase